MLVLKNHFVYEVGCFLRAGRNFGLNITSDKQKCALLIYQAGQAT